MKCSARPILPTTLWCCAKPDQARSDFAAIQSDLQFFMSQPARPAADSHLFGSNFAAHHGQSVDPARGRCIVAEAVLTATIPSKRGSINAHSRFSLYGFVAPYSYRPKPFPLSQRRPGSRTRYHPTGRARGPIAGIRLSGRSVYTRSGPRRRLIATLFDLEI
jgi:hypothetical protein